MMTSRLSLGQPAKKTINIFSLPGKMFKITSMNCNPFQVDGGVANVLFDPKTKSFIYQILDEKTAGGKSGKQKSITFSGKGIQGVSHRDTQFTVHVNIRESVTQLIGYCHAADDAETLIALFNKIKKGQLHDVELQQDQENSYANGSMLVSKEDKLLKENRPALGVLPSGTSGIVKRNRTPLGDSQSFVSPLSSKSKNFSHGVFGELREKNAGPAEASPSVSSTLQSPDNQHDDCTISAVGASKFYGANKSQRYGWKPIPRDRPMARRSIFGKYKPTKDSFTFHHRNSSVNSSQGDKLSLTGFSNLGNTCYMNAILQCLLGMPCFSQDLVTKDNLSVVMRSSLYSSLCSLSIIKCARQNYEQQKFALRRVKQAISSAATRFSGYLQHDAHEFLCQCLDQLKDDLNKHGEKHAELVSDEERVGDPVCPVIQNFESVVKHTICCTGCDETVGKEERCNDFSLMIPEADENTSPIDLSTQQLLDMYFMDEHIEYQCEKCQGNSATLSHTFTKLPRIIVLHIKRYEYDLDLSKDSKRTDRISLLKNVNMTWQRNAETINPVSFTNNPEKMTLSQYNEIVSKKIVTPTSGEKRKISLSDNVTSTPAKLIKTESSTSSSILQTISGLHGDLAKHSALTEGEQIALAARESRRLANIESRNSSAHTKHLKYAEGEAENTSILFPPMKFTKDNGDIGSTTPDEVDLLDKEYDTDFGNLTSVSDDEEEQLKLALELSMRDYEETQAKLYEAASIKSNRNLNSSGACTDGAQSENTGLDTSASVRLNSELDSSQGDSAEQYTLVGVVHHIGQNTRTGHYVSDVYDFKVKKWRSYDDSSVKEVTEHEVRFGRQDSAYIVFYMHNACYNALKL